MRDWKLLFVKGKPLYDEDPLMESGSTQGSLVNLDGNDILDNEDLKEYLVSTTYMYVHVRTINHVHVHVHAYNALFI